MVWEIAQGDALAVLRKMPDKSIDCTVTSPPYYGLRDYGADGQIGLEATPQEYIDRLAAVFAEVSRTTKDSGTCWINIGDSYSSQGGPQVQQTKWQVAGASDGQNAGKTRKAIDGLKPKDLIGIPWILAFTLREQGWWLRQDIIWHKLNPMPESVRDRCTRSHEYFFMFSKSEKYYFDADAIAEPLERPEEANRKTAAKFGGADKFMGAKEQSRLHSGNEYRGTPTGKRNKRDVWKIATTPTPEAHFAVFPLELPETAILAGCPSGGTVLDPFCGAGTTGIAAFKNGRNFHGIELNPSYIDIAHGRMSKYFPIWELAV